MNNSHNAAWIRRYDELKQYKCREGHCNVPQDYNENKSLGKWVNNQRTQYKCMKQGKPSSITEKRIRALEDIGFQWTIKDPNDYAWYKKYEELKKFKCREGHCNVPFNFSGDKSLRRWVNNQRTQYKCMKQGKQSSITEKRIQYLENIGFQWNVKDPNDDAWYKKYEELKDFKCREGHCDVPQEFSGNRGLGRWVSKQRTHNKWMMQGKPSSMTKQRIKYLEEIGFQWNVKDPNDDAWYRKYEELKDFKCREGHCDVPFNFSGNRGLGRWVSKHRTHYKWMMQGKPSSMTKQRIKYLEEIGFQWNAKDPNDDAWYRKYEELKDFKCREGHCDVPYKFSGNKSLGTWVGNQRVKYKNMIQGKPSSMTDQRIQALEDIGFSWNLYNISKKPEMISSFSFAP